MLWILHTTHHHIDHAGQDSQFLDAADGRHEPAGTGVLGIRDQGWSVPRRVCETSHRPSEQALRDAAARLRTVRPRRDRPRHRLRVRRRPDQGSINILVETAEGNLFFLAGDVVDDIQNQMINPIYQVLDDELQSTGNQGTSKRQERAAIKRALNSGTFLADSRLSGPRRARARRLATASATRCRGRSSPSSTGRRPRRGRWASAARSSPFLPLHDLRPARTHRP